MVSGEIPGQRFESPHETPHLDLRAHSFGSKDGRFWSTPEQAEFFDGRITHDEMLRIAKARDRWPN